MMKRWRDPPRTLLAQGHALKPPSRWNISTAAVVLKTMKVVMLLALFTALGIGGCASASPLVQPSVAPWPTSVADVCPTRTVSQECFRGASFPKGAINTGMEALIEALRTCHRPGAESVLVKVTVETRGGSATCVERSPRDDETARCVAAVVARDLQISGSTPDETCRFTYPFRFQQPD